MVLVVHCGSPPWTKNIMYLGILFSLKIKKTFSEKGFRKRCFAFASPNIRSKKGVSPA